MATILSYVERGKQPIRELTVSAAKYRICVEKEEAQKEMLAQYDPFSTQNQNGDGADDDPDNKGDPSQGSQGGEVDE